ncbi:MAG: hypothetical protein R3Y11_01950 [Pseudomonadota bacterium]
MLELEIHDDILNLWIGEHCTVDALNVRLQAERDAIALLQDSKGTFTRDELIHFCAVWNAECFDKPGVPRTITCSRFREEYTSLISSIEKNGPHYIFAVHELWNALHGLPLDEVFSIYTKYMNIQGIELLFSILLYLYDIQSKSKKICYPWSKSLVHGLSSLFSGVHPEEYAQYIVGINHPLKEKIRISSKLSYAGYIMYCEYCDAIRQHCNVYPQEVDFLLHQAATIKS